MMKQANYRQEKDCVRKILVRPFAPITILDYLLKLFIVQCSSLVVWNILQGFLQIRARRARAIEDLNRPSLDTYYNKAVQQGVTLSALVRVEN